MYFLWYLSSLLLIVNSCTSERRCIDSCSFEHQFDAKLILPSTCTFSQRDQCDAILTFDYSSRTVNIKFGTLSRKRQRDDIVYTSEIISHTSITLSGDSSAENIVEYYCSTGDLCEYAYVLNQALSLYIHKTCHHFRVNLISLLHSDPSSTTRSCITSDGSIAKCDHPCDLFSVNPNHTVRQCDGQTDLDFQTSVGRTTPVNKPEYDYRLYSYACTTELCNGDAVQEQIVNLIESDDGECLFFLDQNQTMTTTTTPSNHAMSYSKSFFLCILSFSLNLFYFH